MRDFYKTYENDEPLLRLAMKIGWTLNVVIMEAELTRAERKWYLEQADKQRSSKQKLTEIITNRYMQKPESEETSENRNSSLRLETKRGIINQAEMVPSPCSLAITLSKTKQMLD